LRSKWAGGQAVRAGLTVRGRIPPHFYTEGEKGKAAGM